MELGNFNVLINPDYKFNFVLPSLIMTKHESLSRRTTWMSDFIDLYDQSKRMAK